MKNLQLFILSLTALLLSACGGGSSSSSNNALTGKAFYVDSAVSGLHYVCGTQSGTTDDDGSFTFDVGSSCTFTLDGISLRTIDSSNLEDRGTFHESDITIARILQSLDTDKNANNGITLSATLIQALKDNNITSLPSNSSELAVFLNIISANNGGFTVSATDAQNHLNTTLEGLISNKTLYYIRKESLGKGQKENTIASLVIKENGQILDVRKDKTRVDTYTINESSKTITIRDDDSIEEVLTFKSQNDTSLIFDETGEDKPKILYFTKVSAQLAAGL